MLREDQVQNIRTLLTKANESITLNNRLPASDFSSLSELVCDNELQQEIELLTAFLDSKKHFHMQFATRCRQRANDKLENSLNFSVAPASIANKLYWDVAEIAFPGTVSSVLFPNVTTVLNAEISDRIPPDAFNLQSKVQINKLQPSLVSAPFRHIKKEDLLYYAFSDTLVFDIRSIQNFSLGMHQQLYHALTEGFPELAQALYRHNMVLQQLESDILYIENKGQSPREALERLSKGLLFGGERITGKRDAGIASQSAYLTFFDYFNGLPISLQNDLRLLPGKEHVLGTYIDRLKRGECVETASDDFSWVLVANANNHLLHSTSIAHPEFVTSLHKKYGKEELNAAKESGLQLCLPKALLNEAIETIAPKKTEDIIELLIRFPPEFYHVLLRCQHASTTGFSSVLTNLIRMQMFSIEQVVAIASYFIHHNDLLVNALHFLIKKESSAHVRNFLEPLSEERLLALIQTMDRSGNTLLHTAAPTRELFPLILGLVPEHKRLNVLVGKFKDDSSLLSRVFLNPESFLAVFSLLPVAQRLMAIRKDRGILHKLMSQPSMQERLSPLMLTDNLKIFCLVVKVMKNYVAWNALQQLFPFFFSYMERGTQNQQFIENLIQNIPEEQIKESIIAFLAADYYQPTDMQKMLLKKLLNCENDEDNFYQKLHELSQNWECVIPDSLERNFWSRL